MDQLEESGFGDTGDLAVCLQCVYDDELRARIASELSEPACTFCGNTSDEGGQPISAPFEHLMTAVMEAIEFLYTNAEGVVYYDSSEDEWYGITYTAEDVAYDVCEGSMAYNVVVAVGELLTVPTWTDITVGFLPPDRALTSGWKDFRSLVKETCRFVFLSRAETKPDEPDSFTTIEFLAKLDDIILEHDLIDEVGPGKLYWRGRPSNDRADIDRWSTAAQLGPPPHDLASNNRMSPAGISMFYGSEDVETVVAEIGAHDTRPLVIAGQFRTVRTLRLLNLAKPLPTPSLFGASGRTSGYFDIAFIQGFAEDIAKPVALDGREHIEYVPTQVVTEYLRFVSKCALDGILFRSAQNRKTNCVIFCKPGECRDPHVTPGLLFPPDPILELQPNSIRAITIRR